MSLSLLRLRGFSLQKGLRERGCLRRVRNPKFRCVQTPQPSAAVAIVKQSPADTLRSICPISPPGWPPQPGSVRQTVRSFIFHQYLPAPPPSSRSSVTSEELLTCALRPATETTWHAASGTKTGKQMERLASETGGK